MGIISTLFAKRDRETAGSVEPGSSEREIIAEARRLIGRDAPADAYRLLRQARDRFPGNMAIYKLCQQLQADLAQPILAAELERLNSGADRSAEQCARVADLYRHLGNSAEAIRLGHMAIQADPQSRCGYKAVGRLYVDAFRYSGDSISGMNALRYIAKAHSLAARDSQSLLHLAEIFTILEAPTAAARFLTPVQEAFPENKTVLRLQQALSGIQPENTTQIQDLFLAYEDRRAGKAATESVEVPQELIDNALAVARQHDDVSGLYLVDSSRMILGGFHSQTLDEAAVGDTLGMLIQTCHQNSARMELGSFGWFSAETPSGPIVIFPVAQGVTAACFGTEAAHRPDLVEILEKIETQMASAPAGEVS
ncbi:MAG: hypothetical protein AAF581_09585 [Planctomycetota bacterium]